MRFTSTIFTLLFSILFANMARAQETFDAEKFRNTSKMHKKLVKTEPNWLIQYNIKKALIPECTGSFNIPENFAGSQFSFADANTASFEDVYNSQHPVVNFELGKDYYETLCNLVYERMRKLLKDNGISSTERLEVVGHPIFEAAELKAELNKSFTGEIITTGEIIATASGTSDIPEFSSPDAKDPIYGQIAEIADDLGADGAIKVYFTVAVNENGAPILKKYDVLLDTYSTSFKKGGKTVFKWKIKDAVLFTLDKEVESEALVIKEGKVDLDLFDKELTGMLLTITEMFSYSVSEGL